MPANREASAFRLIAIVLRTRWPLTLPKSIRESAMRLFTSIG